MGWWKADPPAQASSPSSSSPQSPPPPPPPSNSRDDTSSCPVDPRTRAIWLQQHTGSGRNETPPLPPTHANIPGNTPAASSTTAFNSSPTAECSSDTISQSLADTPPSSRSSPSGHSRSLSHDRVISSIPRAFPHYEQPPQPPSHPNSLSPPPQTPSNSESETGPHPSGNWIYPSEHQFFTAVLRKHDPSTLLPTTTSSAAETHLARTIPSIIPIHNAVNERAWSLIQEWERPFSPPKPIRNRALTTTTTTTTTPSPSSPNPPHLPKGFPCTGPKLLSFRGLGAGPPPSSPNSGLPGFLSDYVSLLNPTTALSPKARWNAFLGYQVPFDRHDWVVQRCGGERCEYVVDFYQGRGVSTTGGLGRGGGGGTGVQGNGNNLNFYIDVRPKLNSWEGWKTRGLGWGSAMGVWRSQRE